jgi:hypothetical protein
MKVDHLTEEELKQYRQRQMPPPALLDADDHLAGCAECRRRLERTESGASDAALWRALTGGEPASQQHLSHEELVAFAENDWNQADRQRVATHLANCAECRTDAEDLSRFHAQIDNRGQSRPANIRRRPVWFVPVWASAAAAMILVGIFIGSRFYHGTGQPPQPNVIAQLNDAGGAIRLDSAGQLVNPQPLEAADAAKIKDALINHRIEPAAVLTQLASPPGKLLGGPTPPSHSVLIAPLGTAVISDKPVFRWQPFGFVYKVSIYDARYHKITEGSSQQNEWQADRALPRGEIYTWEVMALTKHQLVRVPVPPEPEARFEVLPQSEADRLEKAQREHPGSHLLLGILYARSGALDDSERELTALLAANPDSRVAKELLASVQQIRRRS